MTGATSQSLSQIQSQKLTTRLSQQQFRFVRLLEMNEPEFEEAVDQELQSNPALEDITTQESQSIPSESSSADDSEGWSPYYYPRNTSYLPENYLPQTPEDNHSLYDHLLTQLYEKELDEEILRAARFIIGNLDSNGYLRIPLSQLAVDLAVNENLDLSEDRLQEALDAVKTLDPPGVGAADLRESLLLQLRAKRSREPENPDIRNAIRILKEQYEAFTLRHTDRLASALGLTPSRTAAAIDRIRQLNPKPGAQFEAREDAAANFISPDFILDETDSGLEIILPNRIPELAIRRSFSQAAEELKKEERPRRKKTVDFISNRISDARDFIKLVSQRQQTLLKVAAAILKLQKEYFETRDLYRLRPMMIKDISALTGLDASVISRATAGKYIQTPWGIFPMRFFFSDTVGRNGTDAEALTNRKLEAEIKDIVGKENKKHPLSDDRIQREMTSRGYEISRRTVAKYRERLGIPVARLRKEQL